MNLKFIMSAQPLSSILYYAWIMVIFLLLLIFNYQKYKTYRNGEQYVCLCRHKTSIEKLSRLENLKESHFKSFAKWFSELLARFLFCFGVSYSTFSIMLLCLLSREILFFPLILLSRPRTRAFIKNKSIKELFPLSHYWM